MTDRCLQKAIAGRPNVVIAALTCTIASALVLAWRPCMAVLPAFITRIAVVKLHGSVDAAMDVFWDIGIKLGLQCYGGSEWTCGDVSAYPDAQKRAIYIETFAPKHSASVDAQAAKFLRSLRKSSKAGVYSIEYCSAKVSADCPLSAPGYWGRR